MAEAKVNMRDALIRYIEPVDIKGYGPGEVKLKEGVTESVELWITGKNPRLFLEIKNENFVNIGETLFTVRNGSELIEITRLRP